MAIDQRAPNDNVIHVTNVGGVRIRKVNGASSSFPRDFTVLKTFRPTYPKGAFTVLSNGQKFRKPTSYTHYGVQLLPGSTQKYSGYTSGTNPQFVEGEVMGAYLDTYINQSSAFRPSPTGGQDGSSNWRPAIPTGMRNEAVTKALLKLADEKAGMGENLATLAQTVDMFHNKGALLGGLLWGAWKNKSLRPFLGKSIRTLKREGIPRTIVSQYLEHIYGWMPLMGDVYALKELITAQQKPPLLLYASGKSSQDGFVGERPSYNDISNRYKVTIKNVHEQCEVKCKLWATLDPNYVGLRAMNQLGLLNPASLAWELTPWSFVVDWFIPIGSTLSALSAPAGLNFVAGTISSRTSATHEIESEYYGDSSLLGYQSTPSSASVAYDGYNRQALTTWPLPGFWVVSNPFSGKRKKRLITSIALLIQNLGFARSSIR